jgi:hypothetical protein
MLVSLPEHLRKFGLEIVEIADAITSADPDLSAQTFLTAAVEIADFVGHRLWVGSSDYHAAFLPDERDRDQRHDSYWRALGSFWKRKLISLPCRPQSV